MLFCVKGEVSRDAIAFCDSVCVVGVFSWVLGYLINLLMNCRTHNRADGHGPFWDIVMRHMVSFLYDPVRSTCWGCNTIVCRCGPPDDRGGMSEGIHPVITLNI